MADPSLTDGFYLEAEERLKKRLAPKRYRHVLSVARMAVRLAQAYGVDERKARLAGLLHDWDKGYDDEGIRERVAELGMEVDPQVLAHMPSLLHGPTAAAALAAEFPEIGGDVLQAIARHTAGAIDMTGLDMVVYIADAIEPLRPYGEMDAIREAVGKADLETLFVMTFQQVLLHLVERRLAIHPDTVRIWNHYIEAGGKGTAPFPPVPSQHRGT